KAPKRARLRGKSIWSWYGLEIQAVYFSGRGMDREFTQLRRSPDCPEFPSAVRRPNWRSSGAKRLMPQLQIKVPTLRRWGAKLAVAVDAPFFASLGGPSPEPSKDLGDGDIIWLVPELRVDEGGRHRLTRGHWEVLTLEESSDKLQAAQTVSRKAFEDTLRNKLEPLS
ncbi:MAG: NotI family restriction endonuclease, partial [Bryobacterales bacterium]|nr:NotI family restriction endonuclease [Bryobacterales bacterium]